MLETVVVAKNCYSLLVLDQMASSLNSADIVRAIATIAGAFQSNQVGGQQSTQIQALTTTPSTTESSR